jgi:uncharacterized protein (DUF302 family)
MVIVSSPHTAGETAERFEAAVAARGLEIFARFDHAANARAVGLELADEVVVVFGNPRAGTLLMQADPAVGIELPLRVLIRDDGGETELGYADPHELAARYALEGRGEVLGQMAELLAALAAEAAAA